MEHTDSRQTVISASASAARERVLRETCEVTSSESLGITVSPKSAATQIDRFSGATTATHPAAAFGLFSG